MPSSLLSPKFAIYSSQSAKYDFLPMKNKKGALEKYEAEYEDEWQSFKTAGIKKDEAFFTRAQGLGRKDVWLSNKDKAPDPIFNDLIICLRQKNVLIYMQHKTSYGHYLITLLCNFHVNSYSTNSDKNLLLTKHHMK